ncbi:MAG: lysophospholipid acyltransferase family protein [Candidatus Protistobacter heckmanni]|nr:lysophospholipid acyltransferase family protein [Candidatus Protistobacter heckmanni]
MSRLSSFLLPAVLTGVFWLLARLPLSWMQAVGAAAGLAAARRPGRYSRRLRENLLRAYPQADEAMFDEAARSAGRMSAEMPYGWSRRDPLKPFPGLMRPHKAQGDALLAQGKGMIIITPHLGCFEFLALAVAENWPLTALYRQPHNPALHGWIERMRTRPNLTPAPADVRGIRTILKALKRGEVAGILPDQVPAPGEGAWAPFFGRKAYTMTLVHRLQKLTGAPLAVAFLERLPNGYRAHFHALAQALPDSPEEAAAVINAEVEKMVVLAPTQYLWGYHRYKVPDGMTAPE